MSDGRVADMFRLDGRVAVVTGSTRGLGLETARAFAEQGAHVVISSRTEEACHAVADELARDHGVQTLAVPCNVSDWGQCDALVEAVHDRFGKVDILVNNAGMSPLYPSLPEIEEGLFDKVVGVNLKGPFRLSASIGSRMFAAGSGAIVNISSVAAIRPDPIALPYAAAKAGLNALTEGFARAYGPAVRVNAIMAGPFLTDISKAWDLEQFRTQVEDLLALQRGGDPQEVVGAAVYLASDASSFCTGAVLRLDGGYR